MKGYKCPYKYHGLYDGYRSACDVVIDVDDYIVINPKAVMLFEPMRETVLIKDIAVDKNKFAMAILWNEDCLIVDKEDANRIIRGWNNG